MKSEYAGMVERTLGIRFHGCRELMHINICNSRNLLDLQIFNGKSIFGQKNGIRLTLSFDITLRWELLYPEKIKIERRKFNKPL